MNEYITRSRPIAEEQARQILEQGGTLIWDRGLHIWTVQLNFNDSEKVVDPRVATKLINEKFAHKTWRGEACNIWRKAPAE